jgi:hypothetical protein
MFGGCDTRLCTPPFRNQRTDRGSQDPDRFTKDQAACATWLLLAVSCIRRVRSRRVGSKLRPSGFTALMVVPRTGWARSSRARGPLARPTWTWFLPDEFRRRDADAPLGRRGRDRTPIYAFLRVRQKASRGQTHVSPERQTPLRGDSVRAPGHIATGHRVAETTPLYVRSGRQENWRCRGAALIGSTSEADKSLSLQRRGHWVPMWGVAPKEGPYLAFDEAPEPFLGSPLRFPLSLGEEWMRLPPWGPPGEQQERPLLSSGEPERLQLSRDLL